MECGWEVAKKKKKQLIHDNTIDDILNTEQVEMKIKVEIIIFATE